MKQIPVIFWTGTGNTQMMADAVQKQSTLPVRRLL